MQYSSDTLAGLLIFICPLPLYKIEYNYSHVG